MKILRIYLSGNNFTFALTILMLTVLGTVLLPGYSAAAKQPVKEETVKAEPIKEEEEGRLDSIRKDSFVINDSVVRLENSVLFYDHNGERINRKSFKVGDQVTVTSLENEKAGTTEIVSITRMQNSNRPGESTQDNKTPEQEETKREQKIRKMNGVWTN